MLTTKDAIVNRRSIRKFKPEPVPDEYIRELLEAARLAPSGSNAQPWRFRVVRDVGTRAMLGKAAHNQAFIAKAPVVIVCCADIREYLDGSVSGAQDLGKIGALEGRIVEILEDRVRKIRSSYTIEQLMQLIAPNVAIAVEHMVLRALDFGLGTCWIRLLDGEAVKRIFDWGDNVFVFALLPVGFPDESPAPRKRLPLDKLII